MLIEARAVFQEAIIAFCFLYFLPDVLITGESLPRNFDSLAPVVGVLVGPVVCRTVVNS